MFNILVIEDDKNLRKLITTCLKREKYNVYEAVDGMQALDVIEKNYINLIITDIMMPQMDGYELIKELREANYDTPILVVTAKSTIDDKKEGYKLGADDYMVKPIDVEELPLRVKALLKRTNTASEKKIKVGNLIIDYNQLSVIKSEKSYSLAQKEFYLLYKLISTPNVIYTRQEIMEEVWSLENESDFRTVDVHIKRIREKLRDVDEFEIKTIRGIGYKLVIRRNIDVWKRIWEKKFNT